MDEKIIFSVLEIEPTKDENQIKDAYRKLLVNVNPEDNAEGFKQLRQAYEEALSYAKREEKEKKAAETPIEKWMERVEKVYTYLSSRIEVKPWKELFADEVCLNLDTNLEARGTLLSFLSDHYRLKNKIWRLIDETFFLQEEKEALYESFPENFINYVIYHCNESDEEDFSYELFEGEDDADYDTFLYQYAEVSRYIEQENWDAAENNLRTLENLPVNHPMLKLEKARYEQGRGNNSLAVEMVTELLKNYGEIQRIPSLGADVLWKSGDFQRGAEYFEQIAAQVPEHYLANKRLAHYYLTTENYKKAKAFSETALSTGSQEKELLEDSHKINDGLIEEFENQEGEEIEFKWLLQIGWCCLENGYNQKGIELACHKIPPKEHCAEHSNLLGRLYLMDKQYDKAIEYTQKRIVLIKEESHKEEKTENDRRMGTAYELWAQAYIGKANEKEEDKELYELALEKMEQALSFAPEDMGYLHLKTKIYIKVEKFREVIDVCDKMEKVEPGNFWTYIFYQEGYFHLRKAQEVIDYFYKAKEVYPHFPKMYELTIQVFLDFDQLENAKGILNQAKEIKLESNRLDLYEVKIHRLTDEKEEDRLESYNLAMKILSKFREKKAPNSELAEITAEIARCCHNLDRTEDAYNHVQEAIKLDDKIDYYWIKGNILLDLDKYEEALESYLPCEKVWENSEILLERIGYCFKNKIQGKCKENYEFAFQYYKRVLEINPDNIRASDEMLDLCHDLYKIRYDETYYKAAITYADKLLEMDEKNEFHYYNTRGLVYMDAGVWDLALADFNKACELKPENIFPYINKGCVYKYTERFDEAFREYEKAAEVMKEEPITMKVYGNLADCYERIGNNEKAIECYEKNMKLFPDEKCSAEDIIKIYVSMGQFDKAVDILEKAYEKDSMEYFVKRGNIYLDKGEVGKGIRYFKKLLLKNNESEELYNALGDAYIYMKLRPRKAIKMYEKRLKYLETDSEEHLETWEDLMRCYFVMGMQAEGMKYFKLYMEGLENYRGGEEEYLKPNPYLSARLYTIASIYLYVGNIEKAEMYTERLRKEKKCISCTYTQCNELFMIEGLILECKGEKEKAFRKFQKVVEIEPDFWIANMKIKELQKEMKRMKGMEE